MKTSLFSKLRDDLKELSRPKGITMLGSLKMSLMDNFFYEIKGWVKG